MRAEGLRGRRALVTGASGFIGGRLAERLAVEHGATVRVLVRTVGRAAPLSRLPVELALGDLRDAEAVAHAVAGCDVVFHCAKPTDGTLAERRSLEVDGTRNLLDAAAAAGAARVVHTSSFVVYELPRQGDLDERSPYGKDREPYAAAKRAAEAVVRRHPFAAAVAIVQPTVVYGPHAGVYGRDLLEELQTARVPLVNGGEGVCNAVYVDDVVGAMILAATVDRAAGETFLVSGAEHPTWAEFYGGFEQMLGRRSTVPLTEAEALAHWRREARRPWLLPAWLRLVRGDPDLRTQLLATREGAVIRAAAERLLPESFFAPERWPERRADAEDPAAEPPLSAFKPELVRFLASKAHVRIDKARDLLGYRPAFGLERGLALTATWAEWEGLLAP